MKRTKTIFLACCFSLFGIGGYAQAPVTVYSGSSLPAEQGWTELKLDATVSAAAAPVTQTLSDGALKLTSVNAPDQFSQLGWYRTNLGLNLSKGYTVEIKAKLTAAQKGAFNIQGYDNEGKGFRVSISETQLTNRSNPLDPATLIAGGLTNDNEFHIYRLVVTPLGVVNVYRDLIQIGTFPLSAFHFDNIVENGGFEDEEFPDFRSANGLLSRTNNSKEKRTGDYALVINSDGKSNGTTPKEGATTRQYPIKPGTKYDVSVDHRNLIPDNEWAWRDFGGYWNTQDGSLTPAHSDAEPRMFWWNNPFEPKEWVTRTGDFTTPNDPAITTVRFEFPSWTREGNKNTSIVAFDNFVLREHTDLKVGPTIELAHATFNPVFPEGYVNLIQNGGFEDWTINNDGTPFDWALSNEESGSDNNPTCINPIWGDVSHVRIQRHDQSSDQLGGQWAHSGSSSLRVSTLEHPDWDFDFKVVLQPNKTYRFNFWHRSPVWNDPGWLKLKLTGSGGDTFLWNHPLNPTYNFWSNADIVFTTTDQYNELHLYSAGDHGNWLNIYFDDLVLYEVTGEQVLDPQIAGKTNLIANGDFEDTAIDNEGNPYEWALASDNPNSDANYPVKWNDQWGSFVRLQDQRKGNNDGDTGWQWAHSGNKSLRFSFLADWNAAKEFEGLADGVLPDAFRTNIVFRKELEPNKTYTFVFWVKASNYNDRGRIAIANGDIRLWDQELSNQYISWTRQSITFSTTGANHTLRLFTEFGGWFNFYLDDLFLYEEDTYIPYEANGDSYIFFGKSTGTQSADVEIEYVKVDNTGAYALAINYTITYHLNGGEGATDATYTVESEAITLPTPVKSGNNFQGWYDNSEFTGSPITEIPQGSTGNKEFWAKWSIISGVESLNGTLRLYPNPVADGKLTIDNILPENGKIEIYNVLGTLAGVYTVTGSRTVIDVSELPAGTYLVKINGKIAKLLKK
jgi:uncharacterized repeat protein (TIGR02543 family)